MVTKTQNYWFDLLRLNAAVLTVVILFTAVAPVRAQTPTAETLPGLSLQGSGPTDAAEMEAFLDELLKQEMEENHIAGAAVSVVKDGEVFFTKGYGYADLENKIPVDPGQTLFKIGSVTKLFTWTAVMQLAEKGQLDLDADVNTYLDFHIPDTYPLPITLRHLMTHTAGFEDLHVDMVRLQSADLAPEGEWLAAHIPARVYPPGEVAAYSNYGAALAGYIVARVSGETYSQYVQRHILDPLGMQNTSAQLTLPEELSAHESVGYTYEDGAFQIFPNLYGQVDLFPAGIIRSTAADMARFMLAQLQDGRYNGAQILEPATAQEMQATHYAPDSRLLGTSYGFFDFSDNGQRVIGHSGEAEPMESLLLLLPEQHVGVFVVYNSLGGDTLTRQHFGFQRAFFDHYYPAPAIGPVQPPTDFAGRADRFVGTYKVTRSAVTTLEKYLSLFYPTVEVQNPGDGTLLLLTPYGDWHIVEESPLYFRQVDGPYHFVFREDENGRVVYLFTDYTPMLGFEKMEWYETVSFNLPLLLLSLLIFLLALSVAFVRAMLKRRGKLDPQPSSADLAYRLMAGVSLLNVLFVVGNMAWGEQLFFGVPFAYKVVLLLGVLSAALTVGASTYCLLAWKNHYWTLALRLYYTLVTVAAVAFIWFLNFWNLLGWRY